MTWAVARCGRAIHHRDLCLRTAAGAGAAGGTDGVQTQGLTCVLYPAVRARRKVYNSVSGAGASILPSAICRCQRRCCHVSAGRRAHAAGARVALQ
ncbi:hypothetical protein EVAR_35674_1 [Eumeta japonica]|uniref:Uncharacterized protein n=1 Tax=Eumeta variegata TaxID=151549 RepID=A0A4C1VEE6_EUMVA|nr:hypothetical protein EVAR_35674_1 [Eumeta japonica]